MAKRRLNKALLRRLARKLRRLRHEEHYDQNSYVAKTACGTAACIAGYAALESGWKPNWEGDDHGHGPINWRRGRQKGDIYDVAEKVLGLPEGKRNLFTSCPIYDWPEEFRERWRSADPNGPAKQRPSRVAADLLDALADGKVEPF